MTREIKGSIEALLFIWGDPIEDKEIAKALDISIKEANKNIKELMDEYNHRESGLEIIKLENSFQFSTRKKYYDTISRFIQGDRKKKLSNSSMEVLTIIAYKQPVTRVEIDDIRGVASTGSIDTLSKKGYIEEAGRKDSIGRPILFRTTDQFLRDFELDSIDDLPGYSDIEMYIKMMENENEDQ